MRKIFKIFKERFISNVLNSVRHRINKNIKAVNI